jgi:protein tyrosine phosphatase (PTP) superfamily phosphohydrolase (DUF442 family)
MNFLTKNFIIYVLEITILLCGCTDEVHAKGFFRKIMGNKIVKLITSNPLKPLIKVIPGPNRFIPIDLHDFKEGIYQDNFHVVQEGALYRSAQLSGSSLDGYIEQYGIKTVINLRGRHPDQQWYVDEKSVADRNHVMLFDIPTSAETLTSKENIRAILEVFDSSPRPILVHCRAGVDRTGEVAALWVLDQQKRSRAEALDELSFWHRHSELMYPAKDFLIKIWRGREWFYNEYNPKNYPKFRS